MKIGADLKLKGRKRSNIISSLKRKNLNLKSELTTYMKKAELSTEQKKHLNRLVKDTSRCANFSLYGHDTVEKQIKYFASVFCGNKTCFVCNYARQKRVRRKYFNWFKENQELILIRKNDQEKTVSKTRFAQFYSRKGWELVSNVTYDLMHLTLTVPHYLETGFLGEKYYFQKIADLYHFMRNEVPQWVEQVYGGEYGIETTKTPANGLHIHIHSLLFVKRGMRNRNTLHRLILKEWNRLTVNPDSTRKHFSDDVKAAIIKSNRSFDESYVNSLDPRGTTMINLEMIYSMDKGHKVRVTDFNSKEMLFAIMETIKYHFEPLAFDKDNKTFDLDLMAEIAPVIYRKQLYKKFGCLHGETALNLKDGADALKEDFSDASELIDEDTGEITSRFNYFVCNPAYVYHIPEHDNEIVLSKYGKDKLKTIEAHNTSHAIKQLGAMVQASLKSIHKPKIQSYDQNAVNW